MSFGYKQHGLFGDLPPISYIDDKRVEKMPHEVCELICLKCMHRWIGVYPETTLLKDIACQCGEVGYVIKTGQTIEHEEMT